jgi:pyruvate dehydrogenase E1 component alpha subunit
MNDGGCLMAIKKGKSIEMYRTMVRIRTFEERVRKEFAAGHLPGFVHQYSGEEAVATGACANLRPDDYITSTHRGHGHLIAKGGRTDRMMAELYGKKTGYCKGKGGCMHIADVEIGILGANGIVGAGITIAGGAALATQMKGTDQVTICFFGDGAINTTRFHEGVNLASIWDLPVIYVIENNLYAESTSIRNTCRLTNLSDRACAYGIPGVTVDGNDVIAVYEAVGKAVTRARMGKGPTLIECKTYRIHGHEEGDEQTYKTQEEIEEWAKKDPIPRFKKQLIEIGVLTEKDAHEIDCIISDEIDKAVKYAEQSPFPSPEETLEDQYV